MFTNKLPNYDDIRTLSGFGASGTLGRWGLAQLGNLTTDLGLGYSLPWFNGFISIVLIAIAACFIISIFDVKDFVLCGLIGGILIVFPAWTCTFFFMYTSVYYSESILLAVLSVFLSQKYRYGLLPGAICLIGSLGIYQAYFPLAAALMLVKLVIMCTEKKVAINTVFFSAIKYLLCLLFSLVLYLFITNLYLQHTGQVLSDYQQINQMGLSNLEYVFDIQVLTKVYDKFFTLFADNTLEMSYYPLIRIFNIVMAMLLLMQLFYLLVINKIHCIKKIVGIIFLLLFPLALLGIFIMCPDENNVYSLMLYPTVCFYIFSFIICEKFFAIVPLTQFQKLSAHLSMWVISICGAITVFFFIHYANAQYLSMDYTLRQSESYYTTMVSAIKNTENYRDDLEVVFIGDNIVDNSF